MTAPLRTVPFISVFMFGVILTRTDGQGLDTVLCNRLRCGFGATCEGPLCLCKTELSVLVRLDTTPILFYCKGICSLTNRICPTSNTTCNTARGANTCDCSPGYTRATSGHCLGNNDQCSSEPCGQNSVCTNTPGSFTCMCHTGFTYTDTSTLTDGCSDIDECTRTASICGNHSLCTNTFGSFTCACESGFTRRSTSDVTEGCVDVDECIIHGDVCGKNLICVNTPGSFYYTCEPGFTPTNTSNVTQGCSDIDECTPDGSICGNNSTCTNSPGSFTCTCESGFTRRSISDVTKGCVGDDDHCSLKLCGQNSVCTNTPGSFTCTCLTGFIARTMSGQTFDCNSSEVVNDNAAIVGAVLGTIIGLLLIGMVIYCVIRYRKSNLEKTEKRLTIVKKVGTHKIVSAPEGTVFETDDTKSMNDPRTYESFSLPSDTVSTNIMSLGGDHYGDQGYYNLDNMSPVYVNRDVENGGVNGPVYTNM